jgi:CheY-like chemotaxis protein
MSVIIIRYLTIIVSKISPLGMSLPIEYSVYSAHDYFVLGLHHLQVALQTQAIAPHSHVEHEAERYDDGCHNVQPLAFEGACVGALRHHGVHAQVVDDSAVACDILLAALQQLPLQAEAVTSANQAWQRLQQANQEGTPFHLLMTDWQMPEMNGIELAQHARELPLPPRMVLVTAFSYDDIQQEAKAVGFEGFLTKPISQSQVVDCLMRLFAPPQGETMAVFEHLVLPQFRQANVLLAEDNPINQQIAVEMMLASGIRTDVAANGHEAISLLFSHEPQRITIWYLWICRCRV